MSLVEGIVSGLIVEAATMMGRRLRIAAMNSGARGELEIARWFDTYQLSPATGRKDLDESLAEVLGSSTVHAIVHELLAVRLSDGPEQEVERLESALEDLLVAEGHADTGGEVFETFDRPIRELVARLSTDTSGAPAQVRQEAFLARVNATLSAIERHTELLARRQDPRELRAFVARYRRQVKEHHGKLEPPDFQRRNRVPLDRLYVPPRITSVGEQAVEVDALDREIDRTVLLGAPGGGKTTCAQYLMHAHACDGRSRVPFLVTLRDFAAADPPERSVAGFIEHRLETFYQCRPPAEAVERLLLDGAALVVFDGLDELVDTSRRAEIAAIVELFCTEYPLARVLVTSRVIGYEQARLDPGQFHVYEVAGFDEYRVRDYVTRWFGLEAGISAVGVAEAFMRESESVQDLRSNPLMLALMCILYRGAGSIPRNRPEVYEECAKLLFTKWDERRKIHVELKARHLIEPALRHLAYWLMTRDQAQPTVAKGELVRETAEFLRGRRFEDPDEARAAAREFVEFCNGRAWVFTDVGTDPRGEELYTFTHRTFMEYFAAAHLAADCDSPQSLARRLAPRIARQEWDVVGLLAVQIKDKTANRGAERVMEALLRERRHRAAAGRGNVLSFLARCLTFTDPSPRLVRELTDRVVDHALQDLRPPHTDPLVALARSAQATRDDVAARLDDRVDELVAAGDVNGLRLALLTSTLDGYWYERFQSAAQRYRPAFLGHLDVPEVAVGACHRGVVTADELVRANGDRVEILFQAPGTGVRGSFWVNVAGECLYQVLTGDLPLDHPRIHGPLAEISRHLRKNHEALTLGLTTPETWPPRLLDTDLPDRPRELSPEQYAALAFVLAVFIESAGWKYGLTAARLGPLAEMFPYLLVRERMEPEEPLVPLPVEPLFEQQMAAWALGSCDFVRP